jgi:hypothetical protein
MRTRPPAPFLPPTSSHLASKWSKPQWQLTPDPGRYSRNTGRVRKGEQVLISSSLFFSFLCPFLMEVPTIP